jgi:hypothetical protein
LPRLMMARTCEQNVEAVIDILTRM